MYVMKGIEVNKVENEKMIMDFENPPMDWEFIL